MRHFVVTALLLGLVICLPYAWLAGVSSTLGKILILCLLAPALGALLWVARDFRYSWFDEDDMHEVKMAIHWLCLPIYCNVLAFFLRTIDYVTLPKVLYTLRFWSLLIAPAIYVTVAFGQLWYWRLREKRRQVAHA